MRSTDGFRVALLFSLLFAADSLSASRIIGDAAFVVQEPLGMQVRFNTTPARLAFEFLDLRFVYEGLPDRRTKLGREIVCQIKTKAEASKKYLCEFTLTHEGLLKRALSAEEISPMNLKTADYLKKKSAPRFYMSASVVDIKEYSGVSEPLLEIRFTGDAAKTLNEFIGNPVVNSEKMGISPIACGVVGAEIQCVGFLSAEGKFISREEFPKRK